MPHCLETGPPPLVNDCLNRRYPSYFDSHVATGTKPKHRSAFGCIIDNFPCQFDIPTIDTGLHAFQHTVIL